MMQFLKRVLTKKKGVTILEGLIALGLLALVAAGGKGACGGTRQRPVANVFVRYRIWYD